ncbi:50S ribosomal protein L20 [Candidatus Saccharibacteria bacterium]|nr:50S ribosomal protein L20 [Candidatus Saccharibacteria bacterium]MBR3368818.1 50S ribosomal protein L20 [Candidatus Saccharibacteria bacterium]
MMRVKRGVSARAKHKKILNKAKGMQHYRTRSFRLAKQGVIKSLRYSYRDRRNKKRDLRALWITRINNASRELGLSYSQLIAGMKAKNITIDRKMLADLAVNNPKAFEAIVNTVKEKK